MTEATAPLTLIVESPWELPRFKPQTLIMAPLTPEPCPLLVSVFPEFGPLVRSEKANTGARTLPGELITDLSPVAPWECDSLSNPSKAAVAELPSQTEVNMATGNKSSRAERR